jgi:hypothetical protein
MILILGVLVVLSQGCAMISELPPLEIEIEILPPKSFFERTFPRVQPAWPTNKMDKRGMKPLQVV